MKLGLKLGRRAGGAGLAALTVFMLSLLSSTAAALDTASLDIVLSAQNPYPVQPGQNVDIEVRLQNLYYWKAENVVVEIVPKEPFTLLPGQDTRKSFAGVEGLKSVSISYRLAVSREALTNSYDLEFRIYTGSSDGYAVGKVQVNVQGVADLVLERVDTMPSVIEPGTQVKIGTALKNVGTGAAHDLRAELTSPHAEIVPLLGKGSVYIGELKPGQSKAAEMLISVDSSAEEKTYTLTLTGSYREGNNTQASKAFSVGLPVKGSVNIDVIGVEANYVRSVVKVEVANKGTADAKSLEAKLSAGNRTLGVYYVSQLKATKKTTLEFPLMLRGDAVLTLNYVGPGIEKNSLQKELVFNFERPSSGDGITTMFYVIVIAVLAFVAYRKFLRKRK